MLKTNNQLLALEFPLTTYAACTYAKEVFKNAKNSKNTLAILIWGVQKTAGTIDLSNLLRPQRLFGDLLQVFGKMKTSN